MSTKEQQEHLWWQRTCSLGCTEFLSRCIVLNGFAQGSLGYLLTRGICLLLGSQQEHGAVAEVCGAVAWLLVSAVCAWVAGAIKWNHYRRKYGPARSPDAAVESSVPPAFNY